MKSLVKAGVIFRNSAVSLDNANVLFSTIRDLGFNVDRWGHYEPLREKIPDPIGNFPPAPVMRSPLYFSGKKPSLGGSLFFGGKRFTAHLVLRIGAAKSKRDGVVDLIRCLFEKLDAVFGFVHLLTEAEFELYRVKDPESWDLYNSGHSSADMQKGVPNVPAYMLLSRDYLELLDVDPASIPFVSGSYACGGSAFEGFCVDTLNDVECSYEAFEERRRLVSEPLSPIMRGASSLRVPPVLCP